MSVLNFFKMEGAGNNFVVFSDLEHRFKDLNALAAKLCDRNFGIGGDGILVARRCEENSDADIEMIIINADGSYASMCGNGLRCFARFVYEEGLVNKKVFNVLTGDGVKKCELIFQGEELTGVKINMGFGDFNPEKLSAVASEEIVEKAIEANNKSYNITSIYLGVPHTVIYTTDEKLDVREGAAIEKHKLFKEGTNINFIRVVNEEEIKVDTWERGAGPTLACGTGCCSSVVVSNRLGLVGKKVRVVAPGGVLFIELEERGVMMTGPAKKVFKGTIEL